MRRGCTTSASTPTTSSTDLPTAGGSNRLAFSTSNPITFLRFRFRSYHLFSLFCFHSNSDDPFTISSWNLIWNASRTITFTVEVRREGECTGIRRGASMEEMSFTWSLQRLQVITVPPRRRSMARIRPVISAPACWICIRLTLSFFLRLLFHYFSTLFCFPLSLGVLQIYIWPWN